jgi:hypothetical protein
LDCSATSSVPTADTSRLSLARMLHSWCQSENPSRDQVARLVADARRPVLDQRLISGSEVLSQCRQ